MSEPDSVLEAVAGPSDSGANARPGSRSKRKGDLAKRQADSLGVEDGTLSNADADPAHLGQRDEDTSQAVWENIQADWTEGRQSHPIDPDSRGVKPALLKGKGKAHSTPFGNVQDVFSTRNEKEDQGKKTKRKGGAQPLQYTRQKSPFHSSQVGKLASSFPHSIGLFNPDYPFTPSGRKRRLSNSSTKKSGKVKSPFQYEYTLPPSIVNSNVMKHGWSASILDDDFKLSVPDDTRRSRQTSLYSRELLGKRWFRWRPGEGWVYSRTKDLSTYKHGPGIALGQLLPPRGKVVTGRLPIIPNDSKRDFVWMLFVSFLIFTLIAWVRDYRFRRSSKRKGKRRSLSSSSNGGNGLFVRHRHRSDNSRSIGTTRKARQRTQAQNFRDLCKFAIVKSVGGMGQAASSTTTGLSNIRWSNSSNGISSGLMGSNATRRGPGNYKDTDGATIELLEKGGEEGGSLSTPVFDKYSAAYELATSMVPERFR